VAGAELIFPQGEEGAVIRTEGRAARQVFRFDKEIVVGANTIDLESMHGQKMEVP
jgi:hypothetical protein